MCSCNRCHGDAVKGFWALPMSSYYYGTGVAESVQCLTTDWTFEVRSPVEAKDISSSLCVQTGSEAHPAFYPVGTGVLSRGKSAAVA
jgi:hypothetical protein